MMIEIDVPKEKILLSKGHHINRFMQELEKHKDFYISKGYSEVRFRFV